MIEDKLREDSFRANKASSLEQRVISVTFRTMLRMNTNGQEDVHVESH